MFFWVFRKIRIRFVFIYLISYKFPFFKIINSQLLSKYNFNNESNNRNKRNILSKFLIANF